MILEEFIYQITSVLAVAVIGLMVYIFKDKFNTNNTAINSLNSEISLKLNYITKELADLKKNVKSLVTQSDLALFREQISNDIKIKFIKMQAIADKAVYQAEQAKIEATGMKQQTRALLGKNIEMLSIIKDVVKQTQTGHEEKVELLLLENKKLQENNGD